MLTSNKLRRIFKIKDNQVWHDASTKLDLFSTDKADFIGFDSSFGGNFEQNWTQQINAALDFPPDDKIRAQWQQETDKVAQIMKRCRKKFVHTKYFIGIAFADAASVKIEFGYKDYRAASRSQAKMISFMKELYAVALKYQQELTAVGYTQAMIEEINDLRIQLDEANNAQELFRRNRNNLTCDRIIKHNAIWESLVRVCAAGKIIYADNPVKLKQYLLPKSRKYHKKKEEDKSE